MKIYSAKQARQDLPQRKESDSKTRGGKCLIIAGSPGMWGAALLGARAATRAGAGYVYLFHSARTSPFLSEAPDFLSQDKLSRQELGKFKAIAIGPGLPTTVATFNNLKSLARFGAKHVVVDASALTMLAQNKMKIPSAWILTPHEGELGRLLGKSADSVRDNREASVRDAQKKFGCVVILKGHGTLVADQDGVTRVESGNSALAKAGTGDVLTGIVTAFLSQGLPATQAACLGVYVHGLIADRWIKSGHDQLSLMASDLIDDLPMALASLRKTVRRKRAPVRRPNRKHRR